MFVDFEEIKKRVSIDEVLPMLTLSLKGKGNQLRGACPACQRGGDRALVITLSEDAYYCFANKRGGDLISLVAHIRGYDQQKGGMKKAALEIAQEMGLTEEKPQRRNSTSTCTSSPKGTDLSRISSRLQHEHEAVQELGFDPDTAEALGIGYDPSGFNRGRVALPVYQDGEMVGYIGYNPDADPILKVHSSLAEATVPKDDATEEVVGNVVRLRH